MNHSEKNQKLPILAGILLGGVCAAVILIIFLVGQNKNPQYEYVTPIVQVITAPTLTQVPTAPSQQPTTELVLPGSMSLAPGTIVEITGTEGAGLRVRQDAGTSADALFLARDGERYVIKEGPKHVDDIFWYRIENTEDSTKKGWAAADYLKAVPNPG